MTCWAGEEVIQDCLVPTFKQSSIRVMIWGCIMMGKKGPLVVLEYLQGKGGGMNTAWYKAQVLEGPLLSFYTQMTRECRRLYFQQDNAASHRSKGTQNWLSTNGINTLYYPPSSPDLNPIEPVWHELKKHIRGLPHPPNTLDELISAVKAAWDSISISDIDMHTYNMIERVQAVTAAKGSHTRF